MSYTKRERYLRLDRGGNKNPSWMGQKVNSVEFEAERLRAQCIKGTELYRKALIKAGHAAQIPTWGNGPTGGSS